MAVEHPAARTTPHEWDSPDYVRFWAERTDREEDERRARFELMADCVPHAQDAPIAILDLGAGYGALTAVLLERFPRAHAVCLDGSAAMLMLLETRQTRFNERISLALADYSQPTWLEHISSRQFDAVVSSQGLHGQRERRPALYREIYEVLRPGGCFLNVDLVSASTLSLRDRFRDIQVRRRMHRDKQATGVLPTYDEVAAELDGLRPGGTPTIHRDDSCGVGDWTEDLRWLREVGFVDVDCYWKELRVALLGGYRESAARVEAR